MYTLRIDPKGSNSRVKSSCVQKYERLPTKTLFSAGIGEEFVGECLLWTVIFDFCITIVGRYEVVKSLIYDLLQTFRYP